MDPPRSLGGATTGERYTRSEILNFLGSKGAPAPPPPPGGLGEPRPGVTFDPSDFPSLVRNPNSSTNSSGLGSSSALPLMSSLPPLQGSTRSLTNVNDGFYSESFSGIPTRTSNFGSSSLGTLQMPSSTQGQSNPFTQAVQQQNPFTQAVQHQQQLQQSQTGSSRHDMNLAGPFGLMGLMGVIRMEDPDRGSLALGTDLTTLGLNLNSSESLHTVFASPFDETSTDHLFSLPLSYPRRSNVRPEVIEKLALETLFVCFYSMPRDVLQILAAQELVNRGWQFHDELRLWFFQAKNGSTVFFDVNSWERRVFSGHFPEGFDAGFLSTETITNAARQALTQLQQSKGERTT